MLRIRAARVGVGILALLGIIPTVHGQGIIVPSAGPINSAMAGASTAAPVDFGSSYWNPATLSGLENQEFLLGSALAFPSIHLQSSLAADSIGGVFPSTNRYGESRSDGGVAAGLATGFSFRMTDDSPLTLGLGVFGLVGGSVNFPGSYQTPILTPRQSPNYFGVGPIYANLSLLGINPMASYQVTDKLAIGGGPVISAGTPSFNPAFFAPGPKDSLGLPTFPSATNARPYWGAGFQLGLLYELNTKWNLGFSYKSPIWQEKWDFNASNPNLSARRIGIQAQIPEMFSWGVAYKGLPKTLIDVDLRYIDYANTSLFGTKVVDGGLGWRSIFVVALGAQYQATDRLTIRGGYLYNMNPIRDTATLFNVQAPGIIQNTLTLGTSYQVNDNVTLSLAWMHGFRNAIQGPILQVPGSSVRLDAQVDTLWAGVNVKFGGPKRKGPAPSTNSIVSEMTPRVIEGAPYIPPPQTPGVPASGIPASSGAYDLPPLPDLNGSPGATSSTGADIAPPTPLASSRPPTAPPSP
jgi:long-chain fatty acid transport protein